MFLRVVRVVAGLLLVGVLLFGASATFARAAPVSVVLFGVGFIVYAVVNFWLLVRPTGTSGRAAAVLGGGLVLFVFVPALVSPSTWDLAAVVVALVVAGVTWLGVSVRPAA